MGDVNVTPGGGSGVDSDNATASAADILSGKTAGIAGADEPVAGTMPNNGAWRGSVAMNSSVAIPRGYHSGAGGVSGPSIPYQNAEVDGDRAYATNISCGPGQINLGVRNGHYLNGVNWIKGSFPTLAAANIKKGVNIGGVVGTWEGYVTSPLIFFASNGYTAYCPNGIVKNTDRGEFIYQNNYTTNGRLDFLPKSPGAGDIWTGGVFKDQFVVTAYNYVSMTYYATANLDQTIAFGVGTNPNVDARKASIHVENNTKHKYTDPITLTINISNLSGKMYVIVSGVCNSSGWAGRITINQIWFHN